MANTRWSYGSFRILCNAVHVCTVHVSSVVTLLLRLSGSRFWCLCWSRILVFLKAEAIKLTNFSRISFCDTTNSKPPSKAPCHRFALPTTGRPWSARGMKMPNCLACALNMCPQIWNSEVVGFPRVPVFSSNWKPKIIPALLFTLLFPVFQTEAFSVWKGSTGLVKPLFACWPIQASSLHSANLKRPSERPSKAIVVFKSSKKTKMFAMTTGVLKSPPCCSSPLRIPKVQRPSKTSGCSVNSGTRSLGWQELSGNFQLCVGFCFKQLDFQSGDFSLILCAPLFCVSAPEVTCAAFKTLVDWRLSWVTIMLSLATGPLHKRSIAIDNMGLDCVQHTPWNNLGRKSFHVGILGDLG